MDVFPECRKLSVVDLRNLAMEKLLERTAESVVVEKEWAELPASYHGIQKSVEAFDKGAKTIYRVDGQGRFTASEFLHDFRNYMLSHNCPHYPNAFVRHSEDDKVLKRAAAEQLFGWQPAEEVPVLDEQGRVCATALKSAKTISMVRWGMVDDAVAKEFFGDARKVLISSEYGDLKGFRERFPWLDVTVFDDRLQDDYLSGAFDMLICGADAWRGTMTRTYIAGELYLDLLAETAVRWMRRNGVSYYAVDYRGWMGSNELKHNCWSGESALPWHVMEVDGHYFRGNEDGETVHFHDGFRYTEGVPESYRNTIYIYGPCMGNGLHTRDDADTIASWMQQGINASGLPYRVITGGGYSFRGAADEDINSIYRIFHTPLHSGDAVIMFYRSAWSRISAFPLDAAHKCDLEDAFIGHANDKRKFFRDDSIPAHMNGTGYRVAADCLLSLLAPYFSHPWEKSEPVRPFPYDNGKRKEDIPAPLKEYLQDVQSKMPTYREGNRIGCIVMNANPMTLGHQYLVRQAAKSVDFLYVFIVEEDKSYFSFADRLSIAKACCRRYENVRVLPSGRFMISSLTFAEYFHKEDLQESTVIPTKDVDLFGKYIAPALHISVRFVGEEPTDRVTRQYNELMKEKLPTYGIELVEIPRFKQNGHPITATRVRAFLEKGQVKDAAKYLPKESYLYLKRKRPRPRSKK